jgi:hypothetical protein
MAYDDAYQRLFVRGRAVYGFLQSGSEIFDEMVRVRRAKVNCDAKNLYITELERESLMVVVLTHSSKVRCCNCAP